MHPLPQRVNAESQRLLEEGSASTTLLTEPYVRSFPWTCCPNAGKWARSRVISIGALRLCSDLVPPVWAGLGETYRWLPLGSMALSAAVAVGFPACSRPAPAMTDGVADVLTISRKTSGRA